MHSHGALLKTHQKAIFNPENAAYATRWVLRAHHRSYMLDVVHNIIHLGREGWPGTRSSAYVVCCYLLAYLVRQDWSPTKKNNLQQSPLHLRKNEKIYQKGVLAFLRPHLLIQLVCSTWSRSHGWSTEKGWSTRLQQNTQLFFSCSIFICTFLQPTGRKALKKKEHEWTHAATPKNPTESRFKMQLKSRLNPIKKKNSTCAPLSVVYTSDPQLAGAHIICWAWNMAIWA